MLSISYRKCISTSVSIHYHFNHLNLQWHSDDPGLNFTGPPQVLRDEIGTAMTNIKSRTDHTYMVRKGRGRPKRDSSRKRVKMYVWHRLCVTLTLRMPDATKLVAVSFRLSEKLTLRILIATKVVAEWRIDPSNICCYQSGSTLSVQELETPISSATTLVANEIRGVNFSLNRNECATNLVAICIRGFNF